MQHRLLSILFFSVVLTLLAGTAQAVVRDPATHFFHESFGDFKEELELAREEGKKAIMLFFEMDECPFCHRMKLSVMNQPEVQDFYRANFKMFSIDVEGDIEMVDFDGKETTQKEFSVDKHRVRATPVIAFFDLEGNLLHRYTGATRDVNEFILMGKFVAEEHYKRMKFTRFKRQQKKSK